MGVRKILMGQVWKHDETGDTYLVTKIYSEVFSTFAMLRKVGGGTDDVKRVKVSQQTDGVALPGFSYTQESGEF